MTKTAALAERVKRASPEELKKIAEELKPKPELFQLLGQIYWLATHSKVHAGYSMATFHKQFTPGIRLNQFRLYQRNGVPIAFANWAWLSDELHERYRTTDYELRPQDWNTGKNLWFPELIAPFGDGKKIVLDLRNQEMFKGQKVHAHRVKRSEDGSGVETRKAGYRTPGAGTRPQRPEPV